MKKTMVILMATSLFAAAVPAMAMDMDHGRMQNQQQVDAQCVKDCDLLLRNCGQEVDSIQQKIQKLQSAVQDNSSAYTRDQLNKLKQQLKDAKDTLETLEKS
jgi:TolA-binding protein